MRKIEELAELMKVDRSTVSRWILDGLIHALPAGSRRRIPEEEFERIKKHGVPRRSRRKPKDQ
jgi:excisionase family DNA binding protein